MPPKKIKHIESDKTHNDICINKYKATHKSQMWFNNDTYEFIEEVAKRNDMPHILLYGNRSCGKKYFTQLLLHDMYCTECNGKSNCTNTLPTKLVDHKVSNSSHNETLITCRESFHYIEIIPNNNNADRYLVHNIINDFTKVDNRCFNNTSRNHKTIVIHNIDNLSKSGQVTLRRTIEKCSHRFRFIVNTESLNKVIDPLLSRFVCINLQSPTDIQMTNFVSNIMKKENVFNKDICDTIVKNVRGDVKKSLWNIEFLKHTNALPDLNYNKIIKRIVNMILTYKCSDLNNMCKLIYSIPVINIENTVALIDICDELCYLVNDDNKRALIYEVGVDVDVGLIKSRHPIFYMKFLIIKLMEIVQK